jgi:hypothetical protein
MQSYVPISPPGRPVSQFLFFYLFDCSSFSILVPLTAILIARF